MSKMKLMRQSSRDELRVDVALRVEKGYDVSKAKQETIIRNWVESGNTPKGYHIEAVEWQNPARKDPAKAAPRVATARQELQEARISLRRFLRQSALHPV